MDNTFIKKLLRSTREHWQIYDVPRSIRHSLAGEKQEHFLVCQPKENNYQGGACRLLVEATPANLPELWPRRIQRSKLKMRCLRRFHSFCTKLCQVNQPLQDSLISNPLLLTYLPSMCDPLLTVGRL